MEAFISDKLLFSSDLCGVILRKLIHLSESFSSTTKQGHYYLFYKFFVKPQFNKLNYEMLLFAGPVFPALYLPYKVHNRFNKIKFINGMKLNKGPSLFPPPGDQFPILETDIFHKEVKIFLSINFL